MTKEEAIKILSERYSSALFSERTALETLIPELKEKESEYERTRKEIVEYFKHYSGGDNVSIKFPKWIEWLETHNPSFKQISDGIIWDSGLRTGIELGKKQHEQKPNYCHYGGDPSVERCKYCSATCSTRITEEQKPAEVDEYKIIKKHITEDILSSEVNKRLTECGWYVTDEKPKEWSEEDKRKLNRIYEILGYAADDKGFLTSKRIIGDKEAIELQNFLKSLRPQPKAELTLLDENIIKAAVAFVEQNDHFNYWGGIDKHTVIKALRSLKSHQKSAEWSKEDEKMLLSIIYDFRKGAVSTIGQEQWLKSLPGRFNLEPKEQKSKEWDKLQEDFRNINEAFENGKKEVIDNPERYDLGRPAEWSKEDEKM